jgi:hypothetical protein
MTENLNYIINKNDLLRKFNIDKISSNIIINFIKFLYNNTKFETIIIDHFFNSFIILINYDTNNINVIEKLLKAMQSSNKLLLEELSEQLNKFNDYDYDDNYDLIIFETFEFLKYFYLDKNLAASLNIIHEIIYNISRINKKIDHEIKARLYVEILNDVLKNLKNKKSNKHIYMSTVETCNVTVRLINEWLDKNIL